MSDKAARTGRLYQTFREHGNRFPARWRCVVARGPFRRRCWPTVMASELYVRLLPHVAAGVSRWRPE
jgi:hypothetical protein